MRKPLVGLFFIFVFCTVILPMLFINGDDKSQAGAAEPVRERIDDPASGRVSGRISGVGSGGNVEYIEYKSPKIIASKSEIYRYEPIDIIIENPPRSDGLYAQVLRDGKARRSGDGQTRIPFLPVFEGPERPGAGDEDVKLRAVYLPDWNERPGTYDIAVMNANGEPYAPQVPFTIKKRPLPPVKKGLAVVNLEMNGSVKGRSFISPQGVQKDYSAFFEWIQFMKADALWILSGETTAFRPHRAGDYQKAADPADAPPWDKGPLENLNLLKTLAPKYGTDIGAYVMCFYVPGDHGVPPRYEAATGYEAAADSLYRARHISLGSERRIQDIIELASTFQNDPAVRYIGFDFIRTGKGDGYELAEEVVEGTNIKTPDSWASLSSEERVRWFAKKIEVEKDPLVIEKWRWWRAHKVAAIIKRVIDEAGITKPVWVFTLGWNHGKEHGQDPVMFMDAGVSIDAVMLYEATKEQFQNLLPQWRGYMRAGDANIIVGNCVDYKLLDSEGLTPPDEMYRRNVEGYRSIIQGGIAKGVFFHDLSRAFYGRRGGYGVRDYALAFQSSVNSLRNDLQVSNVMIDVVVQGCTNGESDRVNIKGFIEMKNTGKESIEKIVIELDDRQDTGTLTYFCSERSIADAGNLVIEGLGAQETRRIEFDLDRRRGAASGERLRFKIDVAKEGVYYITELVKRS